MSPTIRPMRGQKRQMMARWVMRLVALLLLLPATSGGSVHAQDYVLAGEWEITFDILNGQIRATWIGRVWHNVDGNETDIALKVVDISEDCVVHGAPIFGQDDMTLDGVDDYVTCRIPDFQFHFAQMNPRLANCRCYFEGPPYASANVSPVYSTAPQPVVYQERIHLEVMHQDAKTVRFPIIKTLASEGNNGWLREWIRADANNSLGLAQLTLHFFDGEVLTWQSNRFSTWQQDGFQLWAGYNAARFASKNSPDGFNAFLGDNGFFDQVQPDYEQGFFVWESEAQSRYVDEPMPSGFGLAPGTDIYIGHNPITGEFFEGTIRAVAVDPGCRGH